MATATLIRPEEPLDTFVRLVTPERIVFQYPLAGPFRRFVAYLLDLALLTFLVLVAVLAGLVYGGLFALANFVKVKPREITQTITLPKANK